MFENKMAVNNSASLWVTISPHLRLYNFPELLLIKVDFCDIISKCPLNVIQLIEYEFNFCFYLFLSICIYAFAFCCFIMLRYRQQENKCI